MGHLNSAVVEDEHEPSIVSLKSEVEGDESEVVREVLLALTERQAQRVYVDFSQVNSVDETALAALVEAMQRIRMYGGKFGLIAIRPALRHVLELAQLDQLFDFYLDCDAASAA